VKIAAFLKTKAREKALSKKIPATMPVGKEAFVHINIYISLLYE
jgi:hypothetical protein